MEELQADVTFIKHQLIRIMSILKSDSCRCEICLNRMAAFDETITQSLRPVLSRSPCTSKNIDNGIGQEIANTSNTKEGAMLYKRSIITSNNSSTGRARKLVRLQKQLSSFDDDDVSAHFDLRSSRSRSLPSNSPRKNFVHSRSLRSTSVSPMKKSASLSSFVENVDLPTINKKLVLSPTKSATKTRFNDRYRKLKFHFGEKGLEEINKYYVEHGGPKTANHYNILIDDVYSAVYNYRKEKNKKPNSVLQTNSADSSELETSSFNCSTSDHEDSLKRKHQAITSDNDMQNVDVNETHIVQSAKHFKPNDDHICNGASLSADDQNYSDEPFSNNFDMVPTNGSSVVNNIDSNKFVDRLEKNDNITDDHFDISDPSSSHLDTSNSSSHLERRSPPPLVKAVVLSNKRRRIFTDEQDQQLFRVLKSCQDQGIALTCKLVAYAAKQILKHNPNGGCDQEEVSRSWAARKLVDFRKAHVS